MNSKINVSQNKRRRSSLTFILALFSISVYLGCKRAEYFGDTTRASTQLVDQAKSWIERKSLKKKIPPRFTPEWSESITVGDSLLIVKMKGLNKGEGTQSEKNINVISGLLFSYKNGKIFAQKAVEFYGNTPDIKQNGLKIISGYNQDAVLRNMDIKNGIFIMYNTNYYLNADSYTIENGVADHQNKAFLRRKSSLREEKPNVLESSRSGNLKSSDRVMSTIGGNCDHIYLVIYDIRTGKVLSTTYLYDTNCEEPEDNEIPVEPGDSDNQEDQCKGTKEYWGITVGPEEGYEYTEEENVDTRVKMYEWSFLRHNLGLWFYTSVEKGTHKKIGDKWQWEKLEHIKIGKTGTSIGIITSVDDAHFEPVLGIYHSGGILYFNYNASLICKGIPAETHAALKSNSPVWYSDDE